MYVVIGSIDVENVSFDEGNEYVLCFIFGFVFDFEE